MSRHEHPLKGEFDTAAKWVRTTNTDGSPGALEIGNAPNGLVALRLAEAPDGDLLIYTPAEWTAFTEGVKDGEFDLDTWADELPGGSQAERQILSEDGRSVADLPRE